MCTNLKSNDDQNLQLKIRTPGKFLDSTALESQFTIVDCF